MSEALEVSSPPEVRQKYLRLLLAHLAPEGRHLLRAVRTPQSRQDYLLRQLQKLNPGCVVTITPAEAA